MPWIAGRRLSARAIASDFVPPGSRSFSGRPRRTSGGYRVAFHCLIVRTEARSVGILRERRFVPGFSRIPNDYRKAIAKPPGGEQLCGHECPEQHHFPKPSRWRKSSSSARSRTICGGKRDARSAFTRTRDDPEAAPAGETVNTEWYGVFDAPMWSTSAAVTGKAERTQGSCAPR